MTMIHLCLRDPDAESAVLRGGISEDLIETGTTNKVQGKASNELWSLGAAANDLRRQRWGVVAPEGAEGDHLLNLMAPLIALRAKEQRTPCEVYRVKSEMSAERAAAWVEQDYPNQVNRDLARLPRYVAILGNPTGVSWALQIALSQAGAYVGRIAFERDEDYARYAEKIARATPLADDADLTTTVFVAREENEPAMQHAHDYLVTPLRDGLRGLVNNGDFDRDVQIATYGLGDVTSNDFAVQAWKRLLKERSAGAGGLLFTAGHGAAIIGKSAEEQRRRQGAIVLAKGQTIAPNEVSEAPFFPGGIWVMFACFGAGTPSASTFGPWLERLEKTGGCLPGDAAKALSALPIADEGPFVSALPRAALASEGGPLAVIGHVDLAWSHAYTSTLDAPRDGRFQRFQEMLRTLIESSRAGVALQHLHATSLSIAARLAEAYGKADLANEALPRAARLGWMEHRDLASYVLLGDPAVQLSTLSEKQSMTAETSS